MSKNLEDLKIECPKCKTWNWILVNKVFFEPPNPEPKVKAFISMYQPIKETKCNKCHTLIGKPDELFKITNGTQATKYRIKNV